MRRTLRLPNWRNLFTITVLLCGLLTPQGLPPQEINVFSIAGDRKGNVWLNSKLRNLQAVPLSDGGYRLNSTPFLRLAEGQANDIYPDPSGKTIWISGNYGLTGYDTTTNKTYRQDFRCLMRKVELTNDKTLIFNGYGDRTPIESSTPPIPIIAHKDKNLRFEFAAPFYEANNETRFRCRLEGYETKWQQWTPDTYKGHKD